MNLGALMTPLIMLGMKRYKPWIMEHLGLNFIRGTFAAGVASVFVLAGLLYLKVSSKNDTTTIVVKKKRVGQADAEETMTVRDYDVNELTKLCTRAFMGLCLGMLMHIKFKFDEPLLLQAIMLPMQTVSSPIVRVHFWGHPAVGNLKRPFPEPNPFAAFMGGESNNNTAATAPSAARASSAGPQVAVGSRGGSSLTQRKATTASS